MFCMAIEAYDEMCTISGVKVMDWRQAVGCSKQNKEGVVPIRKMSVDVFVSQGATSVYNICPWKCSLS